MARDFDGVDDNISLGSDASVDNFGAMTFACWIDWDNNTDSNVVLAEKMQAGTMENGWALFCNSPGAAYAFQLIRGFSGTNGGWCTNTTALDGNIRMHIYVTHPGTTGDPSIWINGVAQSLTGDCGTPTGTLNTDATAALVVGEDVAGISGTIDFNGAIAHVMYTSTSGTAALMNRHRWWGRQSGAVVTQPWITDKLANEGSGTADGSATGTTVVPFVTPVQRPGSAMMGLGVGW